MDEIHVQVRGGEGITRIEIVDDVPGDPCSVETRGQGFSVKVPVGLEKGSRIEKALDDHPIGWSAFMVVRGEDGSAESSLAHGWSFALVITSMSPEDGTIEGRLALSFDDEEHSGAVGDFSGAYCPLKSE